MGLGRISKIGKIRLSDEPRRRRAPAPVEARRAASFTDETLPDDLRKASSLIGSGKARRIWRLRQKGITGSIPELLVMDWLDRNKIDYDFQVWLPDAHTRLDFLIHPRAIALRIQGEYWHRPEDQNDRAVRYALTLMGFKVIDAFENQIYTNLDMVMQRALAGMEVGR